MSDLFDQAKELFRQTEEPKEGDQIESIYIISRFLSMVPEGFLVSARSNHLVNRLPDWIVYKLMWMSLKQQTRAPYFNYIKRPTIDETDDEVLKKLMAAFAFSREAAEQVLTIFRLRNIDVEGAFGLERKEPKKEEKNEANRNNKVSGGRKKPRGRRNRSVPEKKGKGQNKRRNPFSGRSPFKTS